MIIIRSNQTLNKIDRRKNLAFVPTMGNLHQGHLDLIKKAKKMASQVIVSIYINPIQFNSKSDFVKYPKTLKEDIQKLLIEGIDYLYLPSDNSLDIFNQSYRIQIGKKKLSLCDKYRPGHFEGVLTVVSKFCNLIKPHYLILGKKDYQQQFLISDYLKSQKYPIKVIAVTTRREKNGLAMSSRNNLLNRSQKEDATILIHTLKQAVLELKKINNINKIQNNLKRKLVASGWKVDYFTIRSKKTLLMPEADEKNLIVLVAASKHNVRLIDNLEFCIK
jgi:pantoate--beta-alanine ligase